VKRSFIAYAVALVALSASMAGCNGGGDPTPSPTVTSSSPGASPSVSASPSPSPSPLVSIPAEAMQQTPEGAVAFVKYYFDQVNRAYQTPDSNVLPPLGDPGCLSCAALQSNAAEYVSLNQRFASQAVEITEASVQGSSGPGQMNVAIQLHQFPAAVVDHTGNVVSTKDDATVNRTVAVVWKGDRWFVFDIG